MSIGVARFLSCEAGGLDLQVLGPAFPDASNAWDADQLLVELRFSISSQAAVYCVATQGCYRGVLRRAELARFVGELKTQASTVRGLSRLSTMEEWLTITIEGDARGHFKAKVEVTNDPERLERALSTVLVLYLDLELPDLLRISEGVTQALLAGQQEC